MIYDLNHTIGADLSASPTGDLALSSGTAFGQQRVLRRLLTNPLDYIWQTQYGGGLPGMVGTPADIPGITGIIRGQMAQEAAVSQSPEPTISVAAGPNGVVSASIQYVDADTGQTQTLTVPN